MAIDPVRSISNRSSGTTGFAIARSLVEAGARTIVVSGPTAEEVPDGIELVPVEGTTPELVENPDILHALSRPSPRRPRLVVGFAGETRLVLEGAVAKRHRKGCDWIVANNLTAPGVFGGEDNRVALITAAGADWWPLMAKTAIADELVARIVGHCLVPTTED